MPMESGGRISDIDSAKVDPGLIRDFLMRGSHDEIQEFTVNWLLSIQDALQSRLFQNYLAFHVHFVVVAYVESIGYDKKEFLELLGEEQMQEVNLSMEELTAYIRNLLEKAMELRDQESVNRSKTVLKRALEYIEENYVQETLSLNTVAGEVGVSANYFSAVFSQEMEVTFIEYVTQKRMEKAKKLLEQDYMKITEIAEKCGYANANYFSKVFREGTGMTPLEYRSARSEE